MYPSLKIKAIKYELSFYYLREYFRLILVTSDGALKVQESLSAGLWGPRDIHRDGLGPTYAKQVH